MRALALVAVCLSATACFGSTLEKVAIDGAMASAYRPSRIWSVHVAGREYDLLAGDTHCHVHPPDGDDAVRTLEQTADLARDESLDFVVLTPHVPARFFQEPSVRAWVVESQRALRAAIAHQKSEHLIYVPGFEYTDHDFGHATVAFADLDAVLADVPLDVARAHPERFFEAYVAHGGVVSVNHPLVVPLDSSIGMARANLSWRPWTSHGPFPAEIAAMDRLAQGFEAYNLAATYLRDRILVGDTEQTLLATLRRMDDEIVKRRRRLSPLGGTDSHSHHLRATTFVLSEDVSQDAIRDAILAGRVCIRSGEACTLEARGVTPRASEWVAVGGTIAGVDAVDVRAAGDRIVVLKNGEVVARPRDGVVARVQVDPGRCSVVRARVDAGFSAPIYVNCDF